MTPMIFDTHAHYDDNRFNEDRDTLLAEMPARSVCGIVNAGSDLNSSRAGIAIAARYNYMWAAAGIHPHEAEDAPADFETELRALLSMPRVVAVGEMGLDYHYDLSPRDIQKNVFERQLTLAAVLDLPVIIHSREATEDTMRIIYKHTPRGVVHCFTGSVETAMELISLGMYIGIGGAATFRNAKRPAEVAAAIPIDRLVLETDAPYMSPEPLRGKRCDSSMIIHTAAKIAELRGITVDELLLQTEINARKLFSLDKE